MRRMYSENQIKKIIEQSAAAVVEALKEQDISVKEITSKGISNTGTLVNNGNVSFSGGDFTSSSAKIFENIKDAQGNNRFIEDEIECETISGMTINYSKWSLSGTHLMIVIAGNVANGTNISFIKLATINAPQWILDKIYPVFGTTVSQYNFNYYADDQSTQTSTVRLYKQTTLDIFISSITLTADRNFRIQFDLLIDNASE